jgi:hypothetical protein
VVEESIVDPQAGTMVTRTKNLNHQRKFMVQETQTYTRSDEMYTIFNPTKRSNEYFRTIIDTEAKFTCNLKKLNWFGIAAKLESLGASRFSEHTQRSREALLYVVERLGASNRVH